MRNLNYMFIRRLIYIYMILLSSACAYAQTGQEDGTGNIESGDVNADGTCDISDVLLTVDYILGKHPASFSEEAADMNNDHVIDISDVLLIVDKILGKLPEDDDGTPPVDDDDDANPHLPVLAPQKRG